MAFRHALLGDRRAEDLLESLGVSVDLGEILDHHIELVAHFDGVLDRAEGLLFEGGRPAVPELRRGIGRVDYGRRVSLAELAADPLAGRLVLGPGHLGIVAGGTGDGAVLAQPGVEVEHLAQLDLLGGHGVVGRHGHRRQPQGHLRQTGGRLAHRLELPPLPKPVRKDTTAKQHDLRTWYSSHCLSRTDSHRLTILAPRVIPIKYCPYGQPPGRHPGALYTHSRQPQR